MSITEEKVKQIVSKLKLSETFLNYSIRNASDKMLGFLADYYKMEIYASDKTYYFFIKAISKSNKAKADMVKELQSFEKEILFYSFIKKKIDMSGIKQWSAQYTIHFEDFIVFEDLSALQYKLRNKFLRFDVPHTLEALKTLARFHATSLIYQEKRCREVAPKEYLISDDFPLLSKKSGYLVESSWFQQCMKGALEAIRTFSGYDDNKMEQIGQCWQNIWTDAMNLSTVSKHRKVICHRDLWNNNLLFSYKKDIHGDILPGDCVFVDFQAYELEPPASDIMLLLYCNLEPKIREDNINMFLNHYYKELEAIVRSFDIVMDDILKKEEFYKSADEFRKFGLIACSCLMPQFWIDDDLSTDLFSDTERFNEILSNNKGVFIKTMMKNNSMYKEKVMEIFEEIVERYCI